MKRSRFGFLAAGMLVISACGASAPAEGPVIIETEADFSIRPVVGTFEVTEGADVLGCSGGTFVDEFIAEDSVLKVMTCTSGSNDGTFTADFDPNGGWSIVEPGGDFVGLQGSGEFAQVDDGETFTGDIEYAP
jgi:hypothetical protein